MSIIDTQTVEEVELTAFEGDGAPVHVSTEGVRIYGDGLDINAHSSSRAVSLYVRRNGRNAAQVRIESGAYQAVADAIQSFAERNGITVHRQNF